MQAAGSCHRLESGWF